MKKFAFVLFCSVYILAFAEKQNPGIEPTPLNPYTICLGDKGHNTGHCSERKDGLGSACVDAGFLQSKNCYSQQPREGA